MLRNYFVWIADRLLAGPHLSFCSLQSQSPSLISSSVVEHLLSLPFLSDSIPKGSKDLLQYSFPNSSQYQHQQVFSGNTLAEQAREKDELRKTFIAPSSPPNSISQPHTYLCNRTSAVASFTCPQPTSPVDPTDLYSNL